MQRGWVIPIHRGRRPYSIGHAVKSRRSLATTTQCALQRLRRGKCVFLRRRCVETPGRHLSVSGRAGGPRERRYSPAANYSTL